MSHGPSEDEEGIIGGINVTPLVDITLVLLIIFMVTANYIAQKSIQVQLPKAASADVTKGKNDFLIVLTKKGQIFLNGKISDRDHIKEFIDNKSTNKKSLQAIISADEGARHGEVVSIIDFIRKNGVENFAISVETDVVKIPPPTRNDKDSAKPTP